MIKLNINGQVKQYALEDDSKGIRLSDIAK